MLPEAAEPPDEELLPRRIMSQDNKFYQVLFGLLEGRGEEGEQERRDDGREEGGKEEEGKEEGEGGWKEEGSKEEEKEEEKVREESWRLLNRLETSEEVVKAMKVGGGWEEVGRRGGSYSLLYSLNVIESLLEEEEAGETFMTEFVSKGGFEWIITILKDFNGKERMMLTILDTNIISLALKIVKNYLLAAISPINKNYFKLVNIAKLTYINLDNIAYILNEKAFYEVNIFIFFATSSPYFLKKLCK